MEVDLISTASVSELPYPVMTACVISDGRLPEKCPFVSYEFTPLYSGVPSVVEDPALKLGGVLVESFACCSDPPTEELELDGHNKAQLELKVRWVTPLAQAMGISSQFLAMIVSAKNKHLWHLIMCPQLCVWNGIDMDGGVVEMTDGGGSDNFAIFPALRRGVKKLIICSAPACPVSPDWPKDMFDISGYFGAYPAGESFAYSKLPVTSEVWNKAAQVFERSMWDELFGELQRRTADGRPLAIRKQLRVLPNSEQGITGGYEVDTLWMFNGRPTKWWNDLPAETRDYLNETIPSFPLMSTFIVDYDPETINLVSNICAWQIFQAQGEIADMLARPD